MWRRHSIAAKKAAGDQAKGKAYSMLSKIIQIAAKKGANPKMNPSLELALQKARYMSVPRDIIDRAILKGSGQLEGDHSPAQSGNMEEIFYEGYGPGGVAILVKTLTSNTNRTASSIKTIMGKHWWSLGLQNSVARQFKETGVIVTDGTSEKINDKGKEIEKITLLWADFENIVMELPIMDFEVEDHGPAELGGTAVIYTDKLNFIETQKKLEALHYHVIEADIQFVPENMINISAEDKEKFLNLIDALENDEDVDKVRHNLA